MSPFVPFGMDHLCVLALTALVALAVAHTVRHGGPCTAPAIRWLLAASILAIATAEIVRGFTEGWITLEAVMPLHLCDAAMILAVVGLIRPRQALAEILYFWTLGGTVFAMALPDLAVAFPRWEFLVFFGLHGLVVVAATALVFGMGLLPRRGAALRVFAITNVYALFVGMVNVLLRTNYLYLRAKPTNPTLLDCLGPWPVYIVSADALALGVFLLLEIPFRRMSAGVSPPSP